MLGELKQNISGQKSRELASEIDAVRSNGSENSAAIESMKTDIASLRSLLTDLGSQQKQILKQSKETIESTKELQQNIEESISSIKVISSTIQNNLVTKISDELARLSEEVQEKLGGSEKVKAEVELTASKITEELTTLKTEISKLSTISSKINAKDFELTQVAKHLIKEDTEKLRLMNEVDKLQRMVGGMRRRMN